VTIDALIERLQNAVQALRGEGTIDTSKVSFIALRPSGDVVERVEIISSAYRQIELFKKGLVGPAPAPIPYSPKYLKWRIKKGLGSTPSWTLVARGILYRSMGYFVRDGELYVEYDKSRKKAVDVLSRRVGFHILAITNDAAIEMSKAINAIRLKRFVEALRGEDGQGN